MSPTKHILILLLFIFFQPVTAQQGASCQNGSSWTNAICKRLHQIWYEGDKELYITGYAWHNRYIYAPERIDGYNEFAAGGGFGKGFYDEDGDWHGLSAFVFRESHENAEPTASYSFAKVLHINKDTRAGIGLSLFLTQRPDIFHGLPFPGAAPIVLLNYGRASIVATYIPGVKDLGNIVFVLAKWTF